MEMVFEWINFTLLLFSIILFSSLYTISTLPVTLSERIREKAWKLCERLRIIASIFEFIILGCMIIWIWFPIEKISWVIAEKWWIGVLIGGIISIPFLILMILGILAAGKESISPSEETEMYGGIYKHIRHPQILGEMPLFITIAFMVNSWFLVILTTIYVIMYVPIMIYFEEKDLIKRFGEKYLTYRKEVGALFPKIKSFKTRSDAS